jgi:hypothetical protein
MEEKRGRKRRNYQKGNIKCENIYTVCIEIPTDFGVIVVSCILIKSFLLKEFLPFVNIEKGFE